jgi:hypothetical protein
MEQSSVRMKVKRLMQLTEENTHLEVSVQRKSLQLGGPVPAGAPYFLKILDEATDEVIIVRVNTNDTVEVLHRIVSERVGRSAELELVTGDDDSKEPLNPETLVERQRSVLSRSSFALTIAAV